MAGYIWNTILKYSNGVEPCSSSYFYTLFAPEQKIERKQLSSAVGALEHDHIWIRSSRSEQRCEICKAMLKEDENNTIYLPQPKQVTPTVVHEPAKARLHQEPEKSIVLEGLEATEEYLSIISKIVTTLREHCETQDDKGKYSILSDFENNLTFKELTEMCLSLKELYHPVQLLRHASEKTILGQMQSEVNIKELASPLQLALCKLLLVNVSFGKWAHRFGMSARQFQRVRTRLAAWPAKQAETILEAVIGSYECPLCHYDLVENKPSKLFQKFKLKPVDKKAEKEIETHERYPKLNSLERIEFLFSGKLKIGDITNARK